ncbi:MAG: hypothetical protein PHW34_14085 [Hespellia sp.]|nr:hypothetical protein [Hespellia sp.]
MRENITKIKYLLGLDKLYQVTDISFTNLSVEAMETSLSIAEVPPDEIFDIRTLSDFRIKLKNLGGKVIDFKDWKNQHVKIENMG